MKHLRNTVAAGLAVALASGAAAQDDELVIYHGWSTPAEVSALQVLRDALAEQGIAWKDMAIPHNSGVNVSLVNMVTGGNPPNAFVESNPGVYRDLAARDLSLDLTDLYESEGIAENLAPIVRELSMVDGKFVKVPVALHIDGMVYWNMDVAEEAGVDPASWTSVDEMFADFDKVEEAGFIPAAVGSQAFQVGYLTHALTAAMAGPDIYNRIYGAEPDITAFETEEFADVVAAVRKMSEYAGPETQNRPWNETTNQVINGDALLHIMGDWMKGEWKAAGKEPGVDFGCIPIPGALAVPVTSDAFGLLGGQDEATTEAELTFAATTLSPEISGAFAANKGATPARTDAPADLLDECNIVVQDLLAVDGGAVQNPFNISDSDWHQAIWAVMFDFWSNPDMTTEDVVADLQDEYDAIFY
ncbi:ABC transporter substrate-binding protein [Pelagovum pacificum]|uniref:Probable sugar-binding periplasmic protein n=1 Tax=Pelagovum pacificum TaxID=2588711 RepID=A0A5C5GF59_9RHOB|nr:ABC transporter substrate-binding protein [Pelagovum pacificum]QQA43506.1 carbohydrate ABC transporter substrate-binding protein [Pelagovum pacificum]TNY33358.1 carbohydrate ABC transporter substrate-binding protein [Pelagovum pacificum]